MELKTIRHPFFFLSHQHKTGMHGWGGAQSRKPERKPVLGRSKLILKGLVV